MSKQIDADALANVDAFMDALDHYVNWKVITYRSPHLEGSVMLAEATRDLNLQLITLLGYEL